MRILKFSFIATFSLIAGATGGLVAAVAYLILNAGTISGSHAVLTIFLAPLFQALVVLGYGMLGYPVYKYLAKRGKLEFLDPISEEKTQLK